MSRKQKKVRKELDSLGNCMKMREHARVSVDNVESRNYSYSTDVAVVSGAAPACC